MKKIKIKLIKMKNRIAEKFNALFHTEGEFFASAGRINLIGEHTDYNGGYVFPAALKFRTTIVLRPNGENVVRMAATDLPDRVAVDINKIEDYKDLKWGDYQAGIISELLKDNYDIVGCDMLYDDTLPHGGGLSSSAAIEVATQSHLPKQSAQAVLLDRVTIEVIK